MCFLRELLKPGSNLPLRKRAIAITSFLSLGHNYQAHFVFASFQVNYFCHLFSHLLLTCSFGCQCSGRCCCCTKSDTNCTATAKSKCTDELFAAVGHVNSVQQSNWVFETSNIHSSVCTDTGSHQVHLLRLTDTEQLEHDGKDEHNNSSSSGEVLLLSGVKVALSVFRGQAVKFQGVRKASEDNGEWWECFQLERASASALDSYSSAPECRSCVILAHKARSLISFFKKPEIWSCMLNLLHFSSLS